MIGKTLAHTVIIEGQAKVELTRSAWWQRCVLTASGLQGLRGQSWMVQEYIRVCRQSPST